MKKLLVAALASLSIMTASAQEVTLIRGGSDTGTTAQRSDLYTVALEDQGYKVNRPASMPSELVAELFMNTSDPVIMPWTTSHGKRIALDFTADHVVSIEYSAPMYVCWVKEGVDRKDATVGHSRTNPVTPVKQAGFANFIPYKNNSAATNAAIAEEIDAVYSNQKGATKLGKIGLKCEPLENIKQHMFLLANNVDIVNLRDAVSRAYTHVDFVYWQKKAGVTNADKTGDPDLDYEILRESYQTWAGK